MRYQVTGLTAAAAVATMSMALVAAPPATAHSPAPATVTAMTIPAATIPAATIPAATIPAVSGRARPVVLADGERALVITVGGRTRVRPMPQAGASPGGGSMAVSEGGRTYDLPLAALPFLGRGLDPSLFDAAALAARESGGRIPVQVRYHGTAVPHLPGVIVTAARSAATPGTAPGYLTAASARAFGLALARQYAADRPRASYGTDGMFAGGVSVSLAGPAPAGQARTDLAMNTLTVTGTDLSGVPDTGDVVLVFNVDNGDLNAVADSIQAFANGVATYSLPSGHYFAVGEFLQVDPNNPVLPDAARLDVLPQFTVDADTTVDMSAAAASSKLAMVTPRGATPESSDFGVLRTAVAGPASQLFVTALGGQIWVSPTSARPSVGQLTGYAAQQLASPPGPGTPYRYELSYADPPGTIPPQTYHVQPASLETITDTFYADIPVSGQWSQYGTAINALPPGAGYINPVPSPLSLPGRQTRYVGSNAAATT
jgi:hypothetical protein